MAQKPAKRHVIADVRIKAELSQYELSKILGCAAVTVQRIEQGTLPMSEDMATKAQNELGVSAAWLLANDPAQPAVTPKGGLWTKEIYEFTQGSRDSVLEKKSDGKVVFRHARNILLPPDLQSEIAADALIALTRAESDALIHAMLEETKRLPRQGIFIHRLRKMFKALQEDFKANEEILVQHRPKVQKARDSYSAIRQQIYKSEADRLGF